jgi:hypothetical protein
MMSELKRIARSVSNGVSGKPAAAEYLAEHHPEFADHELAELKLESGFLVETVADGTQAEKIVMLVNRHGFVEEVDGNVRFRQSAQRWLIDLRENNELHASTSGAQKGWG